MQISLEIRLVPTKVDIHVFINHVFGYLKCKQFLMRNIDLIWQQQQNSI